MLNLPPNPQFCQARVISWLRLIKNETQIEALNKKN